MGNVSRIGQLQDLGTSNKAPEIGFASEAEGLKAGVVADYTVCVGQSVTLRATSDRPIVAVQWSVQGETLKSYNLSTGPSLPIYLTGADLTKNPLSFYWIKPGTFTASVTVYTASGWGVQSYTYEVKAPTVQSFTSDTGRVEIVDHQGNPAIAFVGQFGEIGEGILMQLRVSGTQNLAGQIATIQLVMTARTDQLDNGRSEYRSTNGQWAVDNGRNPGGYLYSGPVPLAAGGTATLPPSDGPLQGVRNPPIEWMKIGREDYKMYLMFKPDAADAIWVPLAMLPWYWQGTATWSGHDWALSNAANSQDPRGGPVDSPPGWMINVSSGQWITV